MKLLLLLIPIVSFAQLTNVNKPVVFITDMTVTRFYEDTVFTEERKVLWGAHRDSLCFYIDGPICFTGCKNISTFMDGKVYHAEYMCRKEEIPYHIRLMRGEAVSIIITNRHKKYPFFYLTSTR